MALADEGRVVRMRSPAPMEESAHLATGGDLMEQGTHFWEVEITSCGALCMLMFGAVRPPAASSSDDVPWPQACMQRTQAHTHNAYYMYGYNGGLHGSGEYRTNMQGRFAQGDRVGVLLDLDAGWMRFYRNGTRCGPGFRSGVTGPLVLAVEMSDRGDVVTALPGAAAPEGAGDADEAYVDHSNSDDDDDGGD